MKFGFLASLPIPLVLLLLSSSSSPVDGFMSSQRKRELRELTRDTWYHAYKAYKRTAFPADELLPLSCKPQGHDRLHPENTAVNDFCGDFALTLVDSLDAFAILDDKASFEEGVREVIQHVSFDVDSRVQVFEVTIRMMGGLLSAHQIALDPKHRFHLPWYTSQMLHLAYDLGQRLLPSFSTPTGIPLARIHLQKGILKGESSETCSAGAGSLLLEFITLSRLTNDGRFEDAAKKAFFGIWNRRSEKDLIGNTIGVTDGKWLHGVSSTGAGIDSFFEYAAKAYILFGEDEWYRVWSESYSAILTHIRSPDGFWYRGANMETGQIASVLVDSLSAFFPGVQSLIGDLENAIKGHAVYAFLWKRYKGLPEVYDINRRIATNMGYPLRPEFIESNLYLYQATKDEFYLEIAEQALHDINNKTRVGCGLAAVLDLHTGQLEDKQPSFATSETLKYLFLTFDEDNPYFLDDSNSVYTTEGHMLAIPNQPRKRKSLPLETPICPAHLPIESHLYQHHLSLGVERRTDFEHARYLAGYEVEDEAREIREGRWSSSGWCDMPQSEAYGVELLFAATQSGEEVAPGPSQLEQRPDQSLHVHSINGLRFSLVKAWPGLEGYFINKIAQHKVPQGKIVYIMDPLVLQSMPEERVGRVHLDFSFDTHEHQKHHYHHPNGNQHQSHHQHQHTHQDSQHSPEASSLQAPGLVATFGPSIATNSPAEGSFAINQPSLSVLPPPFNFGCDPFPDPSLVDGKILILRRGVCSFAKKSQNVATSGGKGVIVINTTNNDDVLPTADEEEANYPALVPLILVSNATGIELESRLGRAGSGTVSVSHRLDKDKNEIEPITLGGYTVLNMKLMR